ncbi:MAG: hypothetical protein RL277_2545 [Planctomycetota bacterium]|jgi:hypothetical protein
MKLLCALPLALLTACQQPPADSPDMLAFQSLGRGLHSGFSQPGAVLIRTAQDWQQQTAARPEWQIPEQEWPAIDFGKHCALLVSAGQRSSGGWSLQVRSITDGPEALIVTAEAVGPAPDAIVTMVLTSPWELVTIPCTGKPVHLELIVRQ